jgi:alcohol dehydrogenase YqhD (iron-dependent ADH family)
MRNFTYKLNTKLIFGWGEVARIGQETRDLGRSAIVVTGKSSMKKHGILDKALLALEKAGVKATVFAGIEPNPRCTTVDKAAAVARQNGCEVVVALGGGSALDAAKGIAVGAIAGRPIWDFIYTGPGRPVATHTAALPIVAVPTIAAAGSEFGSGAVISCWETREKSLLLGEHLFPRVAIVDPELTVTVSRQTTGDGGVDIISHALDNYISNTETTPLQDRFSEGVMRTVISYLGTAMEKPQDREARTQLSWASTMANSGVLHNGRNGAGPMHFIEHTLSAHYDISHGRGLATVMPALFRFNNESNPEKYAQLARNVFFITDPKISEKERGEKGIEQLEQWMKSIGMYTRLKDLNIPEACFSKIADDSLRVYEALGGGNGALLNPARRLDKAGIITVLKMCA